MVCQCPTNGSVVNQVFNEYDDFEQLAVQYQEHDGAVNVMTSPKVEYPHADGADNTARLEGMLYPNGRELAFSYGTSGGDDDLLSRVRRLDDDQGNPHVNYTYLGLSAFVRADSPEPQVRWDLMTGGGADPYAGLDRFDRVVDCLWRRYGGTPADLDRIRYGYDRASNRVWRENGVAPAGHDELYQYDGLQRLVDMARGILDGAKTKIEVATFAQDWRLDATGNWSRFDQLDAADPDQNLGQQRASNRVNEITDITARYGQTWATPAYDRAGNMTLIPKPADPTDTFSGTYDAWNRLKTLSGGIEYAYDGLNRRVTKLVDSTLRHFYYSDQWQVLEERLETSPNPDRQYIWGLRYIDDLVLRDRDTNTNGTLDERLYALQDANWNVTAICDAGGQVVERYGYTPYGVPTTQDGAFSPIFLSTYDWSNLYAGYLRDVEVQLYSVRLRYYHPIAATFLTRDPIPYLDGAGLYTYVNSQPLSRFDPFGLQGLPVPDASFLGPGGANQTYSRAEYLAKLNAMNKGEIKDEGKIKLELDKGCVGLCSIRQFGDPDLLPDTTKVPWPEDVGKEMPSPTGKSTRCYSSPEAARDVECPNGQRKFLFAIQGLPNVKEGGFIDIKTGQVKRRSIITGEGNWDYSVFHEDGSGGGVWENIQPGEGFPQQPQRVTISKNLLPYMIVDVKAEDVQAIFCISCIPCDAE